MEGSESEAVFEACNLNPQLFINEILNSVDDVVDGAFEFYLQEASAIAGADRTEELGRVFFINPAIPIEKKHEMVADFTISANLQPHSTNFLNIVVHMRRNNLMKDVVKDFKTTDKKITRD